MSSISGVVLHVKDLDASARFYGQLGLRQGKRDDTQMTFYLNWFWLDIREDPQMAQVEEGVEVYIKVTNADEWYKNLKHQGYSMASEPHVTSIGSTEFMLKDPDGHRLVFYQKDR